MSIILATIVREPNTINPKLNLSRSNSSTRSGTDRAQGHRLQSFETREEMKRLPIPTITSTSFLASV